MISLTKIQQDAIEKINLVPSQTKRGCGMLQARMKGKIRKDYYKKATKLGYTTEQIQLQWQDVKDMALLERFSEE